jgi:osomolarity two-component system response regulator SKN7
VENESSPGPRSGGFGNEELGRLFDMENRVLGLEDQLMAALNEVREARSREMGLVTVMRDMLGHMAATENGESHPASCK